MAAWLHGRNVKYGIEALSLIFILRKLCRPPDGDDGTSTSTEVTLNFAIILLIKFITAHMLEPKSRRTGLMSSGVYLDI